MSQSLGYFLSKDNQWRIILAVAGVIGTLELIGLSLVPESPIWLAEHQRLGNARRILQRIRGQDTDIEAEVKSWKIAPGPGDGNSEEETLLTPPAGNLPPKKPPMSIIGVILSPTYRPAIIAVIAVMVAQQFTGINSIIMYSVSLLSTILPKAAPLLAVIISALNLVTTLICAPLADKLGRKTCLLLSITGMGINSALLALAIALNFSILSAIASLFFVASFAVGLGPVPFILASELVGPEAVGATQSWALAVNWISTFIVVQFFPILNEAMGEKGRVYWIFAGMALASGTFIAWWVPETRGKASAEEVWGRDERRVD
jgi:MFS family permease